MLTSLGFILLAGPAMAALCGKIGLPRIIGMLITGILLGPYVLDLLDPSILSISADLRQMALIIILLKAGLSLDLADLKKVGRPALMMSCVPASFEILAFFLFAPRIMGIRPVEAAVMGAVLGAVSPAVVIPRMVQLMESGYGTDKRIPQLIMAGASCDDIFVIVLFSTFVGMAQGGKADAADFAAIPISIVLGIVLGAAVGYGVSLFFEKAYRQGDYVRNSMKVILVLGVSFLLMAAEDRLEGKVPVSGLLAVVSMACAIRIKSIPAVTRRLSEKFGKRCRFDDRPGSSVPVRGRCPLPYENGTDGKGTAFLRDCLSAQSHGAGGYRFSPPGDGPALRADGSVRGGAGYFDHGASRGGGDGFKLPKAAEKLQGNIKTPPDQSLYQIRRCLLRSLFSFIHPARKSWRRDSTGTAPLR